MWQQIAENKRNTYILLIGMFIFMVVVGTLMGFAIGLILLSNLEISNIEQEYEFLNAMSFIGAIISLVIWFVLTITSLIGGKQVILKRNNAYKLPKNAHLILENVVEEMSIAAGLSKVPEIFVIDSPVPNAFATGINPKKSAVAVTTGLLTKLNRDELQGVIAHEIAHIVNRDTMYMLFAAILIGTITVMAESAMRITIHGGSGSRCSSKSSGNNMIGVVILLLCSILAPILAQILYFSVSQRREYLADACAAQFTRYPQGLASALSKISTSVLTDRTVHIDKATASMCIINQNKERNLRSFSKSMFEGLFSTHPPTMKRIDVLLKMTGADLNSYNDAFREVSGRKTPILKAEDLQGSKPLNIRQSTNGSSTISKDNIMGMMTMSAMNATAAIVEENKQTIQEEQPEEIRNRKREATNIIWKANDYIFKTCECGTKLKFPKEYEGQEINCPHCKKTINVVKNEQV